MKTQITIEELMFLLSNEETKAQTISDYFYYFEISPFSGEYRLKETVVLTSPTLTEKEEEGFIGSNLRLEAMHKANNDSKEKRHKKYETIKTDESRIRIVSKGDSWFQYPKFNIGGITLTKDVKDIIDYLMEDSLFAIKSLDAGGDIIRNMYHGREYIGEIKDQTATFFLLSAGGNDFFEVFPKMLHANNDPNNIVGWLSPNYKTELNVLSVYYKALISELIDQYPELKIIIHGYDYIIPKYDGKWIGGPMVNIGIKNVDERKKLITFIMDEFNYCLKEIADQSEFKDNVTYIDLRGTVPQDSRYWHDEIHPNDRGFELVANKFKDAIRKLVG